MFDKTIVLIIVLAASASGGVGFVMGNFMSSYGNNLCYSAVVSSLSEKAVEVAELQDAKATSDFKEFLASLPNNGNESSCNEILSALNGR